MGTERQVAGDRPLAYEQPSTPTIVWLTEAFWGCRFGALSRAIWQLQLDFRFGILILLCNAISFHVYWIATVADLGASCPYDVVEQCRGCSFPHRAYQNTPSRTVKITIHGGQRVLSFSAGEALFTPLGRVSEFHFVLPWYRRFTSQAFVRNAVIIHCISQCACHCQQCQINGSAVRAWLPVILTAAVQIACHEMMYIGGTCLRR
jgi:hypothetical protein